ncbi:F0F1 ATP synthase subunit A [Solitalea sp. MAHUQ-68]|uniref:ATP synthase subunit a n=1 Tax=Solitalea agri TaxID=2953739 RepID=A0A9X2F3I7_9SPHI|nr:F0F1 ATP synthase subunit A [Solitalea agri]MCO4293510.1 F0F1 ATP synthase subunit A [Solitalea agri]
MRLNTLFLKKLFVLSLIFAFIAGVNASAFANSEHNETVLKDSAHVTEAHVEGEGHAAGHGEEPFEPTKVIMEHISDSHDWHLWGHTSIGLPVILKTDAGIVTFNSSEFHHDQEGTHVVEKDGQKFVRFENKIYYAAETANEKGQYLTLEDEHPTNAKPLDFSITKNVASMFLSAIILCLVFFSVAAAYRKREGKAPRGLQSFIEPIIVFVRDEVARPNIGHKYVRYMPFLLTVFFFILINNLIGLIPIFPGGSNLTGNIAVTFVLGTITFLVTNFSGNKYYWKHVLAPDVPWWLYPIMLVVEVIGLLSKPFALIIRLFANITAGHIIVLSLISLIFIFKTLYIAPVSVAFVLFMDVLELLVAFLQAFIFTMLTALFIGTAVEEHHH